MTIDELYGMMLTDDKLVNELFEAIKEGKVSEWAAGYGVEATEAELVAYAKANSGAGNQELSIDELDDVAGGGYNTDYTAPTRSVLTFGTADDCNL